MILMLKPKDLTKIICDICKEGKEISVKKYNGKTYVVCDDCVCKIPEVHKTLEKKPIIEPAKISTGEQIKSERKKFEAKQSRIKEKVSVKEKEMVDIAINSKSKTLFGGKGKSLFQEGIESI